MLKSLDLYGFKSFADRNRFEFSPGLTVIVGPNGSGKSNVVDAIKWVLGEKSMKSLRGKESSDVIFNGSSTRKPTNSAEVSLTFDNSDKKLNFDASEVVVTRRAFRGGEGSAESEYFLNRQPCKLKDIRDLLLGTGLGTHAYSIIEQGRVDSLLQSSPRDRRILFEEAAGISRFKAKKQEALNRLERIDQNLLRLSDIVEEVQKRYERIQTQAQRAMEFRELTERLEKLRFQAAAMDYSASQTKLQAADSKITDLTQEQTELQAQLDTLDASLQQFEQSNSNYDKKIQVLTEKIAANRHSIGASESVVTFQTRRMNELDGEINSGRTRIAEMRRRLRALQNSLQSREEELTQAQSQHAEVANNLLLAKSHLDEIVKKLDELRTQKETLRELIFDQMRQISAVENVISSLSLQEETARRQLEQNTAHIQAIQDDVKKALDSQSDLERQQSELEALKARCVEDLTEAKNEEEAAERLWNDAKNHLMELHRRHSAMLGRISTLEELQERHEGLSPGVRYLLTEARRHADGPFRDISGLVADLIQVDVDAASLIEVALGEKAQYLVVEPNSTLLDALRQNSQGFPGRVGFIWMDDFLPPEYLKGGSFNSLSEPLKARLRANSARFAHTLITNGLEKVPGVVGRADQFIECEDRCLPLFKYLLGETWIVEDLGTAMDLSRAIYSGKLPLPVFPAIDFFGTGPTGIGNAGDPDSIFQNPNKNPSDSSIIRAQSTASGIILPQIHFVTLAGERYSADGVLAIGPQHASSNLISRRSELRTLGSQLTILSDEIVQADEEVQKTQGKLAAQKQNVEELEDSLEETEQQLIAHRQGIQAAAERQNQLDQRIQEFTQTGKEMEARLAELQKQLADSKQEKETLERTLKEQNAQMNALDAEITGNDEQRGEKNRVVTECKVELAKSEERLESLDDAIRQLNGDCSERGKIITDQESHLAQNLNLFHEAERLTLANNARLADFYLAQENCETRVKRLRAERDSSHSQRSEITGETGRLRKRIRQIGEKVHALELEKGTLEHEAENVVVRLCEDYSIEPTDFLQKIESVSEEEKKENAAVHREINQLRSRIHGLGNINSEALNELDELKSRYEMLNGQYQEILAAKEKLLKLIDRVNHDSRVIFMKTFDQIGEYFYHIFRDLFGGGNAELQLTECADPLEAGIEIVAQPPGKQRLNMTLMSGGEKTLTCVALLFALFKNHPTQFCILDEVDAALDEANTVRLTEILHQFCEQTQFIIISHSRKTMSVANTIYGVTMQDSGISKQVSVKFEEVSDDGVLESLGIRLFPAENQSLAG